MNLFIVIVSKLIKTMDNDVYKQWSVIAWQSTQTQQHVHT